MCCCCFGYPEADLGPSLRGMQWVRGAHQYRPSSGPRACDSLLEADSRQASAASAVQVRVRLGAPVLAEILTF
jgi:hypothetical protein